MAFRTNKVPAIEERTVSGSSVSFNSAFALPLKACKVSFSATQSGSGTPSPQNVRNFVGVSAINISHSNRNLLPYTFEDIISANGGQSTWTDNQKTINGLTFTLNTDSNSKLTSITINGTVTYNTAFYLNSRFTSIYFPASTLYSGVSHNVAGYSARISHSGGQIIASTTAAVAKKTYSNCDIILFFNGGYTFDITVSPRLILSGESDNLYVPHEGTYTTIQIGSTVYGGEYDARTGVLTVNVLKFNDWNNLTFFYNSTQHFYRAVISDMLPNNNSTRCNIYNYVEKSWSSLVDYEFGIANNEIRFHNETITPSSTDFKALLVSQGVEIIYPLATPQTIQLPPCPIDTLLGVNNIWADTGDINLTYKDLDIAKRGNFREVFKLPS